MNGWKYIVSVILLSLVPLCEVFAQEDVKAGGAKAGSAATEAGRVSAEVSATGVLTSIVGNKAKFNEYRDVRDGVYGGAAAGYDSDKYFLEFNARDMGYDTQRYNLEGRKLGDVRFDLFYNEIPHNFTFDAKSFYSGVGSANLSFPGSAPSTNVSTWNNFDYSVKRKNFGGGLKVDKTRPFFFDASASREERNGTYPLGVAGTTPGGIAIELPAPIDYRTDNFKVAAGYNRNPLFMSVGFFHSRFENSNLDLNFRNPATANTAATTDTLTLAPENEFYKVDLKGGLKLPFRSKLDLNLGVATAKSDRNLLTSYVDNVTAAASNIGVQGRTGIGLSSPVFNGKIETRQFGTALTSKPLDFLDTRVFFKYDERENKSDQITTTDTTQTPSVFTNPLFDYRRVNYGAEVGFRLPARLYLNTLYSHGTVNRQREDIPENRDDLYRAELRWKGTNYLAAKIGYERLKRAADFEGTGDAISLEPFIRRFDAAARTRNAYNASLELYPLESLSVSLGYGHKETQFKDTILGLQSERRDEYSISADYEVGKRARLFAFFDYDRIRTSQFQRQLPAAPGATVDPSTPPTSTSFNWTAERKDETYSYSVGTDIFIIRDKLTLRLQHSYVESDGFVDYTYLLGSNPLPTGRTQDNIDIPNWDDYRLRCYLVKLTWQATRALTVAGGYAYEKFTYSDAQFDGYQYVPATTGTNGAFLTGAYSSPSYESHVAFITLSYRF